MTTDIFSGDVDAVSPASGDREFSVDGVAWIARLAGRSAAGSGVFGLGMIEAVDFALAASADAPVREALIQRGRFEKMYDAELITLLAAATKKLERPN